MLATIFRRTGHAAPRAPRALEQQARSAGLLLLLGAGANNIGSARPASFDDSERPGPRAGTRPPRPRCSAPAWPACAAWPACEQEDGLARRRERERETHGIFRGRDFLSAHQQSIFFGRAFRTDCSKGLSGRNVTTIRFCVNAHAAFVSPNARPKHAILFRVNAHARPKTPKNGQQHSGLTVVKV